jgi:hypothetical protein
MSVRPIEKETIEQKQQRLKNQRDQKESKERGRLLKKEDEKQHAIEVANIYNELGVDLLCCPSPQTCSARVIELWEGKRVDRFADLSGKAQNFLKENFDISFWKEDYITVIHFNRRGSREFDDPARREVDRFGVSGKFYSRIAVESGQTLSTTRCVYQALLSLCRIDLKSPKRRFHAPGLGHLLLRYRRPTEPQPDHIPMRACLKCSDNGKKWLYKDIEKLCKCRICGREKMCRNIRREKMLPGKPARNQLRITPSKSLKTWAQSVEVVPPVKHRKKEKKRHRRKKIKYINDEQKEFHIT